MVDLVSEAVLLQKFFEAQKWRFCFIGGFAVQHWGEPRFTRDLDLSLLTGFGDEERFVDVLLSAYRARIENAKEFAVARRVLLLRSESGVGIDISLAALPYEETVINRASLVEMLPGAGVRICSPEDLIIMKMFAGRDTDLRDVRSVIVRRSAAKLDWQYIEANLADLSELSDDPGLIVRLKRIREAC